MASMEVSFIELLSKLALSNFVFMKPNFKFLGEMGMMSNVSCQIEMKLLLYMSGLNY